MNTATLSYERAVAVPGLAEDRRRALLEQITRRNQTLAGEKPLAKAIARCAAALMAADSEQRLASPAALAQAELLARLPAGRALEQLQSGLIALQTLNASELATHGAPRSALCLLLRHVQREASELMDILQRA
jgi:hypothetical protein